MYIKMIGIPKKVEVKADFKGIILISQLVLREKKIYIYIYMRIFIHKDFSTLKKKRRFFLFGDDSVRFSICESCP